MRLLSNGRYYSCSVHLNFNSHECFLLNIEKNAINIPIQLHTTLLGSRNNQLFNEIYMLIVCTFIREKNDKDIQMMEMEWHTELKNIKQIQLNYFVTVNSL